MPIPTNDLAHFFLLEGRIGLNILSLEALQTRAPGQSEILRTLPSQPVTNRQE